MKQILLGDEAIAQAAIDAGLSGVYAYPGTPSTEITEYIQLHEAKTPGGIFCQWATNEKTAMEAALGMTYAGKRALVCMKHVGMNVCADAFVNSAITGVNGGLVVVAADDPSMHSSQNEQDSRFYAKFALIPCFEPSNQQEAYDMTRQAFELSEKLRVPILLRVTTRMAHSRAMVETTDAPQVQNERKLPTNAQHFILLPAFAKCNYADLLAEQPEFVRLSEVVGNNVYQKGTNPKRAIVACGIAYNYMQEAGIAQGASVLKITQYPLPIALINKMIADGAEEILVAEEGQPVVEELLRGLVPSNVTIRGRLTGALPRMGELSPDCFVSAQNQESKAKSELVLPGRPPSMCQGCGHRDMYTALNEVAREYKVARIFGDIGCYTLGALSPFHAIHSCVEMGASITMAKGAVDAGQYPAFAVIGDSTFTHSGMTGLLDCANCNADVVVLISDNLTTGMTGGQDSAGTGKLERICMA
ncbi:MAG: indolepyruvate ferredoxin oxidoreductase, partial [Paludibacteraceae bacterium]|nr:indolepyruvate ferredoxin oxidoreductase [Paludibacteraceae bacterium]